MYDYDKCKDINDLNYLYQPKDFYNPHKDCFEYFIGENRVEMYPDLVGYQNGDIVVKIYKDSQYKIRYSYSDSVWICDTDWFISSNVNEVLNHIHLVKNERIIFFNAIKECYSYIHQNEFCKKLDVDEELKLLGQKIQNSDIQDTKNSKLFSKEDSCKLDFLKKYMSVEYQYSVYDTCVYVLDNDIKLVTSKWFVYFDFYSDSNKSKTIKFIESLVNKQFGIGIVFTLKALSDFKDISRV